MVTRCPCLIAQRPRIWPMRMTPCPPNPEMRISVRVFSAVADSIPLHLVLSLRPPLRPHPRVLASRLGRQLRLHPRVHLPHDLRELRPAVGGVVLDAGLPREIALGAVRLPALGMLVDPLEVLERVARAEGVGAEVLVARKSHVDER